MSSNHFPKSAEIAEQGRARNLHTGLAIAVIHDGQFINQSIGDAGPNVPLTDAHIFPWLSAGKPITSVAVLRLVDRKLIELDAPVAKYLPEFSSGGKEVVTVRHMLTHATCLPFIDTGWPGAEWDQIIERILQTELRTACVPGEQAAYDPGSTWFLLGEILQRVSGQSYADVIDNEILKPCGLQNTWLAAGVPRPNSSEHPLVTMYERQAGQLVESEWNDKLQATLPAPGSSLRGTATDLCRFFDQLRCNADASGQPILSSELWNNKVSRQREGLFDETLQHTVDYGLGVIVDSNRYGAETVPYGFGKHCSEQAFGHGGSQCAIGFADPAFDLAVAIIANGRPGEGQHQRRFRALCTAVYEDLGLA